MLLHRFPDRGRSTAARGTGALLPGRLRRGAGRVRRAVRRATVRRPARRRPGQPSVMALPSSARSASAKSGSNRPRGRGHGAGNGRRRRRQLAGDPRRAGAGEERHHGGDVIGGAGATEGHLGEVVPAGGLVVGQRPRGVPRHQPGPDPVTPVRFGPSSSAALRTSISTAALPRRRRARWRWVRHPAIEEMATIAPPPGTGRSGGGVLDGRGGGADHVQPQGQLSNSARLDERQRADGGRGATGVGNDGVEPSGGQRMRPRWHGARRPPSPRRRPRRCAGWAELRRPPSARRDSKCGRRSLTVAPAATRPSGTTEADARPATRHQRVPSRPAGRRPSVCRASSSRRQLR